MCMLLYGSLIRPPTSDGQFCGGCIQIRMQVAALFLSRFVFLHLQGMGFGIGIVTNSADLPGHLHSWPVGSDREAVMPDFPGDDRLRELSDHGQLIAEIAIEHLEVIR